VWLGYWEEKGDMWGARAGSQCKVNNGMTSLQSTGDEQQVRAVPLCVWYRLVQLNSAGRRRAEPMIGRA